MMFILSLHTVVPLNGLYNKGDILANGIGVGMVTATFKWGHSRHVCNDENPLLYKQ